VDTTHAAPLHAYYELGKERERLTAGAGRLELMRTIEIVSRHLPPAPAVVADIGGGPGRYTTWLADLGHRVHHRDLVPLHVEQVRDAHVARATVDTAVGDARSLDLDDASVDAVLLLGPLYHLSQRPDRVRALREARRVVRPGGPIFVAAITRWSARISVLVERLYQAFPAIVDELGHVERTGELRPLFAGSFNGFMHRPAQLRAEIRAADLTLVDLVSVEGPAALLTDLDARLDDPDDARVVVDTARALERVPELLGVGPHLLATVRRPLTVQAGTRRDG